MPRTVVLGLGLLTAVAFVPQVRGADIALGEQVFKKCERCHTVDAGGAQAEGPNLHGIFGRKAGTAPGWQFSDAMKASNVVWNRQNMDEYLAKPKEFMPDGTMNFPGLRKPEERQAVIDYLEQATK
ncbi:MAG: cytochrome c family protein [Rhodospirillales bacterium]|nr:cytochrome c family protein [Rhodospirillales bacterium]